MIPLTLVRGYDTTLTQLSTAALGDLRALMNSLGDIDPSRAQVVLQEAFPEVFNPYAAASSAVSASFYEEVRDYAEVRGRFDAETLDDVDPGRYGALVGWGARPSVFERGGQALAYSLLSGGLTQILTEMSADTIIGNAAIDPTPMGYQRVPRSGCCAFCGMLASRGAAYTSKEAAEGVVGRGVPVEQTKGKRGGQGKGIKPRGSRSAGESFHDACKCRAVPVNEGNAVEMQAGADKYFESYERARVKVNEGLKLESKTYKASDGSLKNTYEWVDAGGVVSSKQKTKNILAGMRQDLGVS